MSPSPDNAQQRLVRQLCAELDRQAPDGYEAPPGGDVRLAAGRIDIPDVLGTTIGDPGGQRPVLTRLRGMVRAPWRGAGDAARAQARVAGEASAAAAEQAEAAVAAAEHEPAIATRPDRTAAAFFDVDNTIMQGASIFHFARGLYRRRLFRTRDIARFGWQQILFRVKGAESPEHMQQARASVLSFIEGYPVADLVALSEEIYDEIMARKIWPGTRALAQRHLDQGQRVWLVTATPVEMARIIAARLGLTGALGTVGESRDGVYTGRLVGELLHGPAKAEALRALAEREGLDLSRCSAYSDSANDIPMLSLVGHPCAVNPDSRLREHAKSHGWRVRDYRTGRKAARIGLVAAAAAGAVAGGMAAAVALRRRGR